MSYNYRGLTITVKAKKSKIGLDAIPGQFPMSIVNNYFEKLNEIIEEMEEETLKEFDRNIQRYINRMDSPSDDIESVLQELRENHVIKSKAAESIAKDVMRQTRKFSIRQVDSQIEAIVGVNPNLRHPSMKDALNTAVKENVRLIKTIPQKYHDEVERVIHEGALKGNAIDEIRDKVSEAGKHTTNNAKLIARDQVGSFMAKSTEIRQTQANIEHYIWRTVGDNRVRDSHEDFDGERFSWEEGSPEGHPGEPIQCRCVAIPDEEEVKNNWG